MILSASEAAINGQGRYLCLMGTVYFIVRLLYDYPELLTIHRVL